MVGRAPPARGRTTDSYCCAIPPGDFGSSSRSSSARRLAPSRYARRPRGGEVMPLALSAAATSCCTAAPSRQGWRRSRHWAPAAPDKRRWVARLPRLASGHRRRGWDRRTPRAPEPRPNPRLAGRGTALAGRGRWRTREWQGRVRLTARRGECELSVSNPRERIIHIARSRERRGVAILGHGTGSTSHRPSRPEDFKGQRLASQARSCG